jgi:Spy/CpxP family protein refolding chaperone
MKTIQYRFLIAAAAVLLGTAIANSQTADTQPPPPPMRAHVHGFGPGPMGFFAKELNLTDEQKAQAKTILQKDRATVKPLMQQSHEIELQMRQSAEGTTYDEAKVQGLATQKAQIEAQLDVQRTKIHNQLFQILTPEQQSKMKELEAQHEAHMQERMQKAPPAPPQEPQDQQ